ncbi:CoA pyrophosphatase [uncultured Shimia sp.]|uniref:NUDIX hydrolase n=1 Tax=uncultured Shimia sp. TaxID=573152 RepID=UPI00261C4D46|nr:CoA pyrophosphatase [uncultured Shimia sp.]
MTFDSFDTQLEHTIRTRMAGFRHQRVAGKGLRQAAVAIVIMPCPATKRPSVLLTLRPASMNRHAGQYALPGGRLDTGETQAQAALREVREEVGLDLQEADILGRLDDFETRSGFCIASFVVWGGDGQEPHPDPSEVQALFYVPFEELDSPEIPELLAAREGEAPVLSAFIPTLGHNIFAPTAALLYQFREVALRGNATRVAHFEQPSFTWS